MARKIVCNCCGKDVDYEFDVYSGDFEHGYGSKYDGKYIQFDICMPCFDKIIESMVISPIEEE